MLVSLLLCMFKISIINTKKKKKKSHPENSTEQGPGFASHFFHLIAVIFDKLFNL